MEIGFARVDGRLSFMQWQMGIIGTAIAAFLGVSFLESNLQYLLLMPSSLPGIH